jgi:hypothetical protein
MTHMDMPFLSEYDKARFWSKVEIGVVRKGKCWPWTAGTDECGYGKFRIAGKSYMSHRIVFQLIKGDIPNDLCVCHVCDNPPCCNPDHMWLGTFEDNMVDKVKKGRCGSTRGEANHRAKLTDVQVYEIREFIKQNISIPKIAKKYGLGKSTIYSIKYGISWKHLK